METLWINKDYPSSPQTEVYWDAATSLEELTPIDDAENEANESKFFLFLSSSPILAFGMKIEKKLSFGTTDD